MTFLSDGWTLQGATITLLPSPPAPLPSTGEGSFVDVAAGTATIDCDLAGGALVKTGGGTLVLGGVDSYSCSTTVSDGMLQLQNGAVLPAGTALTVNGGILDLGGARRRN